MRSVVLWFVLAVAVAATEYDDEPAEEVEEEDVDDPYSHLPDEEEDYRRKRDIHDPYEEHVRVKRCCDDRVRRSADYVRTPRQVHQYEVHEFTDEHDPSSPPYEEMLAASADHYHSVYAAPGAPKTARYLNPDVSSSHNVLSSPSNHQLIHAQLQPLKSNVLSGPSNQVNHGQTFNQHQQNHPQLNQPSPFLSKIQAPAQYHVSSPVSTVSSSVSHEVPLPAALVPLVPLQQLDGDQSVAAAGHHHQQKHGHGHSHGGGHGNHAKHHKEQGGTVSRVLCCMSF